MSRSTGRFAGILLAVTVLSAPFQAVALLITPTSLTFEARLDDPTLLTVEVDLGPDSTGKLDADITGFDCDRRITPLGAGKYKVEIAPDTIKTGSVQGDLLLRSNGKPLGQPVPISGSIRPWIRTTPSRIFLGSIGKGATFTTPRTFQVSLNSDTEPFDVTSVELPEIAGASWKCDPPVGQPALKKTLSLTFSPDALAGGFPFGALAIKYLVVETTHPRAQRLVLPIQAMISVNTTGRDYSQYLYKGNLRWQGPWGTPNMAAAFLAGAMILVCGIGASIHNRLATHPRWRVAIWVVFFILLSICCHFLVLTYSRGGWIAAATGVIVLGVGARGARIYPATLAAIFAVSISLHPAGLDRVASTSLVMEDKSISHRLLLWRGAFQMMMEHPWAGVGKGRFGDVFSSAYQLPGHKESYSTAINDFLTLGTERGIAALILLLSTALTLGLTGLKFSRRYGNAFLAASCATLFTLLVASWFSSIAFQCSSSFLLLIAVVGIPVEIFHLTRINNDSIVREIKAFCLTLLTVGGLTAGSLGSIGIAALASRPATQTIKSGGLQGLLVSPRWFPSKGLILYFGDRHQQPQSLLQSTLRPLAQEGWRVICFETPKFDSDTQSALRAVEQMPRPDCIAGNGKGASLALLVGAEMTPQTIACYFPAAHPSFEGHSISGIMGQKNSKILFFAEKGLSFSESDTLHITFSKPGVEMYSGANFHPLDLWTRWIHSVNAFGSAHLSANTVVTAYKDP